MNKRTIFGLLILGVGLIALAGSLGYVEVDGLWSTFWPVILIAIGLVNILDQPKNWMFNSIIAILGVVFLLRNLGIEYLEDLRFWEVVWPVIIIYAGIWLLSNKKVVHISGRRNVNDDAIEAFALFSGADMVSHSQDFKGGDVFAMFGGVDLNLRSAVIQDGKAKLDVFCMFGGVDIKVPEDWRVKVTGLPLFGGWGNKTSMKNAGDRPVDLEVNCLVLFGGMDIKN